MSLELPSAIAQYFTAGRDSNPRAMADCFSDTATVRDENYVHTGREEIRQWKVDYSKKFTATSTPIAIERERGRIVVTCHVEGNFPGSPIDLRHFFRLEGDKIGELEITL
ncbi:nuclear transport factor 2 family protein [Bosea rubneri]|uniref:Nuclear transport factor 2 family protein n=1 Tax=Bosea rubneri TaxID=3075434 RepID=A0ABU3SGW8_9HYPH|nr:nuclear transport factor 2 family protein [Bosea sp. ZW T0_25]MDU0343632.1 nuclear transport factor 2 family protein [Bosea sp. ZW T0_25]